MKGQMRIATERLRPRSDIPAVPVIAGDARAKPIGKAQTPCITAMMFPSVSVNHAAFAPPWFTMPFLSFPGMS